MDDFNVPWISMQDNFFPKVPKKKVKPISRRGDGSEYSDEDEDEEQQDEEDEQS